MYDQTGHEIPTLEQLLGTKIILDMDRGEVMRVEPIHQLIDPIISYLPPARKSYDEFTITIMKPSLVIKKKRFSSCFSTYRHGKAIDCTSPCSICGTREHFGSECTMVYASMKW